MTDFAQPPAPWSLATLAAVIAQVRSLDPAAVLIEGSFPFHRLACIAPAHPWLLPAPARTRALHPLFRDFSINESTKADADMNVLVTAARNNNASPWLMVDAEQATGLPVTGATLLVHASSEEELAALDTRGLRRIRFVDADGAWAGYSAFLPDETVLAGAPDEIALGQADMPGTIWISPRDMISDCPWAAEGDESYSWIWTGPEIVHRICLGHLPQEARAVAVHFLDSVHHEGIAENLVIQVNGRPLPMDTSQLQARHGRVQVTLPDSVEAPVVLGVCAFPESRKPADEIRHIRVAIEAMEILT